MTHMPVSHKILTTATPVRPQASTAMGDAAMGDLWTALVNAERAGVRSAIWETASCRRATEGMAQVARQLALGGTAIGVLSHMAALLAGHVPAASWSIAPMMLFLCLTLLPGVWLPAGLAFLRQARREFALGLAIWIVLHAFLATGAVLAAQPEGWQAHWGGLEVLMGMAGLVILGGCLVAAHMFGGRHNGLVGRILGRSLWLIPTLGLIHGWISTLHYGDSLVPSLAMILPVLLIILMPAMAYLMGRDMRDNLQRMCALILGTGVAVAMVVMLAPVGGAMSVITP